MAKTVVGLFNSRSEAEQVKQDLISDGYESSDITVMGNGNASGTTGSSYSSTSADTSSNTSGEGIGEKIEHFFSSLMGGDDHAHEHYASGLNEGGALLAVRTEEDDANEVAEWLSQHGARNIDRNAQPADITGSQYNRGGDSARDIYANDANQTTGSQTIPVVEEDLEVGKRTVDRGGVRVYSHVVEKPAEADVTLRNETINVERRAVDRPATAADFAANSGKTIEVRAQGEEAVVGKTARVVEEVVVGKQVAERTEQVHENVRNTEVDVENISADSATDRDQDRTYAGSNAAKTTDRY